jgi:class 3 adenylate cyclase
VKLTPEVRAFAMEQAGRRCECSGKKCRHHLAGLRCKRGLRGDQWKVFWRSEGKGATRDNIEAWCVECFANNFEVPRETVALLCPDILGYARLIEEDQRRALTLKSVLRDATVRAAGGHRGRVVLDRLDDDILVEFATSRDAVEAARNVASSFRDLVIRLDLPVPGLCGAIHCGEVTRWRNGILVGDAVGITTGLRGKAGLGQILLTEPAIAPLMGTIEMEPVEEDVGIALPTGGLWALRL